MRETLLGRTTRSGENRLVRGILGAEAFDDRGCEVRVALGDEGKLVSGFVTTPDGTRSNRLGLDAPAVFNTWLSLNATEEVAKSFQSELHELGLKSLKLFDDARGGPYVVRLAMAPQSELNVR